MRPGRYPTTEIRLGGATLGCASDIELYPTLERSGAYYDKDREDVLVLNLVTHAQREIPALLTISLSKMGVDSILDELLADTYWEKVVTEAVKRGKEADEMAAATEAEDHAQMKRECRP